MKQSLGFCILLRWYFLVENPGVVSLVFVFCILFRWYACGKPRGCFICFCILLRWYITNETTPEFSTNIYHLNKIQNTTTNETIPRFPTSISSEQKFCWNDIFLWKTQGLFRLFLSFVFCSDDMLVGNLGIVSFVVFCTWVFHKHISSQQNTKHNNKWNNP
jgi:hypothetical protein